MGAKEELCNKADLTLFPTIPAGACAMVHNEAFIDFRMVAKLFQWAKPVASIAGECVSNRPR
jgi:hypothetical protein